MISYYQETKEGLELIKQETFHFSGPKSMVGNYKNGIRNGDWTYWYENGMIGILTRNVGITKAIHVNAALVGGMTAKTINNNH